MKRIFSSTSRIHIVAFTLSIALGFVGCVTEETGFLNPDPAAKRTITADEGGSVTAKDGTSVFIPPGALGEDTQIVTSAAKEDELPALPAGRSLGATATSFTPHGLSFAESATIRLPYDPSIPSGELAVHKLENPQDQDWELVSGATFSNGFAEFETRSFSIYAVTRVALPMFTAGQVQIHFGYNRSAPEPGWVAYRDGDGSWQQVSETEDTVFTARSGRYEVVVVCGTGVQQTPEVHVIAATPSELQVVEADCPNTSEQSTELSGTFSDFTTSEEMIVYFESSRLRQGSVNNSPSETYRGNVSTSVHDLVATKGPRRTDTADPFEFNRIHIERDFNAQSSSVHDISFGQDAEATVLHQANVDIGETETFGEVYVDLHTQNGTKARIGRTPTLIRIDMGGGPFYAPAASQLISTDRVVVTYQPSAEGWKGINKTVFDAVNALHNQDTTVDVKVPQPYSGGSIDYTFDAGSVTQPVGASTTWARRDDASFYNAFIGRWRVVVSPDFAGSSRTYAFPQMGQAPQWVSGWVDYGNATRITNTLGVIATTVQGLQQDSPELRRHAAIAARQNVDLTNTEMPPAGVSLNLTWSWGEEYSVTPPEG